MNVTPYFPEPQGLFVSASGFRRAVRPVLPSLTRFARRLTANDADGEDLVQETLLKAWAARARFEPGTNLRAWLMRIARNAFLSSLRKAKPQVALEDDAFDRLLSAGPDQETGLLLAALDDAVAALPPHQGEAFQMIAVEGHSYEDAARALDVQPGTLKSRVARARSAVVGALEHGPAATPPVVAEPEPVAGDIYRRWKNGGGGLIG
ncbi:RNA polymerase sigma-70 factor, ECF subfamily [Sphingomonas gellani]|uniref:RNA polymerase sigma-70 factor, ECF subfamily n=1 Tax=Sphingomonas gellani TaxID=1166340 RepID=A0A1H8AKK1_9SPHN|nr:RNA polymerase sigma factor [Sphingomonas gellani]SEM71312.1 RNA polymerase sigma-70 factor, ECF subfamily [Sphingomonas gellani]